MKRESMLISIVFVVAAPAQAQMFNFPDYSMPSGAPATGLATHFGRGLDEDSGKLNSYGLTVSRSGIAERFSARFGIGMVDAVPDSEITLAGAGMVRLTDAASPTSLGMLAGVGYMKVDPVTLTRFPIGVTAGRTFASGSATVYPWVIPRMDISRASAVGASTTETNFGASGGVTIVTASGLGVHVALDLVASDPSVWQVGGGVQYVIR